ncbi:MAG: 3-phosphoshikimate 1-carboxyvinyltransferase [Deltaproteobacteria bacterium RIFCSPLOWO2_12_FULL_40_28]|nr:MAG: 3-phosphoshikimate 1-carboxyvinyltransferase [Deltaproteobacteria bacterium RIFCSPHIGHO2_02_FULL_40_28]OGQ20270.1 MAG: 3-phosphoshikimate 1-carboxyvinyltransferase [Deltaproteobacteria bacterium RIFCSPHIGHO2_12_FULL_40_32]OGQ40381.1 MAG: 3-phosphoshikimate 1-carboxyvinyltransferase [Deltaproteobacteria bacterium RIFCSPLOWO2_02_FULL_40_36]OGQ54850.1 MAG: 3-phosphoshikimate 1-carboxyvinyltransferase [Deltaproteobacteria bacterium RIFCSPLOWO2_12_FULL_40_28]
MITVFPAQSFQGTVTIPGDKSISHRALLFSAFCNESVPISNLLLGEDVLATCSILQSLGVKMSHKPHQLKKGDILTVEGCGGRFTKPEGVLDCGNSGTTLRTLLGLLAAQPFESVLTGDDSLNRRPMERVINPLTQMGASFKETWEGGRRFIYVQGNPNLNPIDYTMPQASAQVQTSLILAALAARKKITLTWSASFRDHTERLLSYFKAKLVRKGNTLTVEGGLEGAAIQVPGDFSSASFFIVAGLLVPRSKIILKAVGLNPTRTALLSVLQSMGGKIEISHFKDVGQEPRGDLMCESSSLVSSKIVGNLIPNLIDEIPILSIAQSQASGLSHVRDALELRVKESDRIAVMRSELKKVGINLKEVSDGYDIKGSQKSLGGSIESYGDHRIAMSFAILALVSKNSITLNNTNCVSTSFPGFFDHLKALGASLQ